MTVRADSTEIEDDSAELWSPCMPPPRRFALQEKSLTIVWGLAFTKCVKVICSRDDVEDVRVTYPSAEALLQALSAHNDIELVWIDKSGQSSFKRWIRYLLALYGLRPY